MKSIGLSCLSSQLLSVHALNKSHCHIAFDSSYCGFLFSFGVLKFVGSGNLFLFYVLLMVLFFISCCSSHVLPLGFLTLFSPFLSLPFFVFFVQDLLFLRSSSSCYCVILCMFVLFTSNSGLLCHFSFLFFCLFRVFV